MSNRHELRDRWYSEDLRARETPDFERETAAPVERNVGDPRWGTGGMRGDELGYRAAHDASEGSWAGELRRSVVVRTAQPQVEWQSEATPVIPLSLRPGRQAHSWPRAQRLPP